MVGRRIAKRARRWGWSRGRSGRLVRVLSVVALVVVGAALSSIGWLTLLYPLGDATDSTRGGTVVLDATENADELATKLAAAGLLDGPRVFATYVRLIGADARIRPGQHRLRAGLSVRQTLERIAVGYGRPVARVTIPEGATRFDVAHRFATSGVGSESAWLDATADDRLLDVVGVRDLARHRAEHRGVRATLEGFLFPDTYEVRLDATPASLVEMMLRTWKRRTATLVAAIEHSNRPRRLDLHAHVILASIVEREARVADEQAVIAGVFLNRMFQPQSGDNRVPRRLQADPTVAYGCLEAPERSPSCDGFDQRVTPVMTAARDNPYSTYAFDGLPPGPIASPGTAALAAVLDPREHDYLYFVAIGGGRHRFSRTLDAHNRAVKQSGSGPGVSNRTR